MAPNSPTGALDDRRRLDVGALGFERRWVWRAPVPWALGLYHWSISQGKR